MSVPACRAGNNSTGLIEGTADGDDQHQQPGRPAGGVWNAGNGPESSTSFTDCCLPSRTRPANSPGPARVWTAPTSARKGRAVTGLSPVDRRKTGSKHYVICDGRGTPLHFITTAANVNDITQALILVDGIPPVAGRPGRPRRRPDAVLGDKAYDSKAVRRELRRRRILPVISRKGASNIKGVGKLRYVVEQTFALLHQFKALPSDGSDGSNFTTP
ncbi:transposase [Streptomyces olivaceus]